MDSSGKDSWIDWLYPYGKGRLFQFEYDLIKRRLEKEARLHSKSIEAFKERGSPGELGDIGDVNANVSSTEIDYTATELLFFKNLLLYRTSKEIDQERGTTLDEEIDTAHPVAVVQEGVYVILECKDTVGGSRTVEKYVMGHLPETENKILGMESKLGLKLLGEEGIAAGIGAKVVVNDRYEYTVLELSWGFPVRRLELGLDKEYDQLSSTLEDAIRTHSGIRSTKANIKGGILFTDVYMEKILNEFSERLGISPEETREKLSAYVNGSKRQRIISRVTQESQNIHYYRLYDAAYRHIQRLSTLLTS